MKLAGMQEEEGKEEKSWVMGKEDRKARKFTQHVA